MADDGWTRMPLGYFVMLQRGHDLPDERRVGRAVSRSSVPSG